MTLKERAGYYYGTLDKSCAEGILLAANEIYDLGLTEGEISLALEHLRRGRTCFVIAHRLATIRGADRILVLDQGGVAEWGTHEELLEKEGIYAKLYAAQWSDFT